MRAQATMKNTVIPTHTAMSAAVAIPMSMKNMHTHTATHVVADIPMKSTRMNIHTSTHMATHAVADIPMRAQATMKNTVIPTHTATHVAVAMSIPMSTHMHMLIPTDTTFPVTPLTASAKSAIRMRNTATFAAKA